MAKRRDRGENTSDLLGELSSNESTASPFSDNLTASEIADAGYDSLVRHDDGFARINRNREKIVHTSIESISPNRSQPRRAIPSSVRQYWSGSSDFESMANFFNHWLKEINEERKSDGQERFPLDAFINGETTERSKFLEDDEDQLEQISDEKVRSKEAAFMPLVELAASIKRDGLINPVSIAKDGLLWQIETGERRWLAYHLLNWHEVSSEDWRKIPARQVANIDIWRQATENNARADLNAIATARQFALLLMDLRAHYAGDVYQAFDAFEHEQDFYAQVKDGNTARIPYGKAEMLINAMGISDVGQLRHIRRLLRLPNLIWVIADDLNWTESYLQKNIITTDEDETTFQGVHHALKQGYPQYLIDGFDGFHMPPELPEKARKHTERFRDLEKLLLSKVKQRVLRLSKADRKQAIAYLEDLIEGLRNS